MDLTSAPRETSVTAQLAAAYAVALSANPQLSASLAGNQSAPGTARLQVTYAAGLGPVEYAWYRRDPAHNVSFILIDRTSDPWLTTSMVGLLYVGTRPPHTTHTHDTHTTHTAHDTRPNILTHEQITRRR